MILKISLLPMVFWATSFVIVFASSLQDASNKSPAIKVGQLKILQQCLAPYYRLLRPEGEGPFPAVIIVPGCSGAVHPRAPNAYVRYAEHFQQLGHAVLFVDYVSAEGIPDACWGRMSSEEVAQYLLAAVDHVTSLNFINRSEIRIIGWSLGGGGVLAAMGHFGNRPGLIRRALVLYPVCRDVAPWEGEIPVLILLPELDNIQPATICRDLLSRLSTGVPVEVQSYVDAHHGFDWFELPEITEPEAGPTLGFNPLAAAHAWAKIERFLTE